MKQLRVAYQGVADADLGTSMDASIASGLLFTNNGVIDYTATKTPPILDWRGVNQSEYIKLCSNPKY